MPKIVDHTQQRELIAAAALRLIGRDGLEATTVRAIASEAGMSVGAMRHYLPSQDDLFIFAMRVCSERTTARIAALEPVGGMFEQLMALLEQILPLDDERRIETEVWLAFVARAQTRPALQAVLKDFNDGLLLCIAMAIEAFVAAGVLAPGPQRELETERLLALINGVAINALLWPETMTPQRQRDLLHGHLTNLGRESYA